MTRAVDHHPRTIRCADGCGCIQCYADRVCAAVEHGLWLGVLLAGAVVWFLAAVSVSPWCIIVSLACLAGAGWHSRIGREHGK